MISLRNRTAGNKQNLISCYPFYLIDYCFLGYLVVNDREVTFGPHVQNHEYGDLIKKYWAVILVVLVCVITAFLMPLIGLCFCCCRCAGSCGGRSQPFDKKHDTCRRFFLGFCLLVVASSMM